MFSGVQMMDDTTFTFAFTFMAFDRATYIVALSVSIEGLKMCNSAAFYLSYLAQMVLRVRPAKS